MHALVTEILLGKERSSFWHASLTPCTAAFLVFWGKERSRFWRASLVPCTAPAACGRRTRRRLLLQSMAGDLVTPVTAAGIRKAVSLTVRGSRAQDTPPPSFSADSGNLRLVSSSSRCLFGFSGYF